MKKVSVILTVFNGQRSIRESLGSLIKQSYKPYEIIVVDDGSSDSSSEIVNKIIKENPKSNIKLIRQTNQGRGHARNNGFVASNGDIITFCEDDAFYTKDYLKFAIKHFENNSVGGVIGPHYVWNKNESIWTRFKDIERRRNFLDYIPQSCWFYRSADFLKLGKFDTNVEMVEDVLPGKKLLKSGKKIIFEEKCLWLHREPSTLKSYVRRKYRGGLGLSLLYKSDYINFPISNSYFMLIFILISFLVLLLLALYIFNIPSTFAILLFLTFLLLSPLFRFKDLKKSFISAKDSKLMVILSFYVEYVLLFSTFVGILKGIFKSKESINNTLKGR